VHRMPPRPSLSGVRHRDGSGLQRSPRPADTILAEAHGGAGTSTLAALLAPTRDLSVIRAPVGSAPGLGGRPEVLEARSMVASTGQAAAAITAFAAAGLHVATLVVVGDGPPAAPPRPGRSGTAPHDAGGGKRLLGGDSAGHPRLRVPAPAMPPPDRRTEAPVGHSHHAGPGCRDVGLTASRAWAAYAVLTAAAPQPGLPGILVILLVSGLCDSHQVHANAAFVAAVPDSQRGQAFGLALGGMQVG
jgi:hypothetical protein